jgi:hypothetical protein
VETTGLNILAPAEHQPHNNNNSTKSKLSIVKKFLSMKITTGKIPHHLFFGCLKKGYSQLIKIGVSALRGILRRGCKFVPLEVKINK